MNTKLYVGNLPFDTSESALRALFTQAGAIVSVTIPLDRMTSRPRGFAFVEMQTADEASRAIRMFDGRDFEGRTINVSAARPPEPRNNGGYGGTSGRGDRDRRGRNGGRRY
ncbi:MAG: RNA-binding protein [Thermoflexales bacterium]|nr:RNA-binding protein [Thermoflexales bacterium]MDW8352193.1 RNA-binding protein [Anaerolineae bacterium]